MISTLPRLPIFEAIANHDPRSIAVAHSISGRRFTYGGLLKDVASAKQQLRQATGSQPVEGQRFAFLVENSYDYVGATCVPWAPWREANPPSDSLVNSREQWHCSATFPRFSSQRATVYTG